MLRIGAKFSPHPVSRGPTCPLPRQSTLHATSWCAATRRARQLMCCQRVVGEMDKGQRLAGADDAESSTEGMTRCDNCRKWIPAAAMMLHAAQCARRNVR